MPEARITADIGFEKQIWDAACVLRGNMDASEYKNIVLGLIFLKYISDRFEERYLQLVAEGIGLRKTRRVYFQGIFFVPPDARWSVIAATHISRRSARLSTMPCAALSGRTNG